MTPEDRSTRGLLVSGRFAELEDALCDRVLELRDGRPLTPLTIVVGSAAVRTRVGDLLVRRLGAVANVSIVTLTRFAAELVSRDRGAPPVVLTGLARERLVWRVVREARERGLAYYGPVCERPHFARALAATFADLREAVIDPGSEWAEAAVGAATTSTRGRSADLQEMYAAYCGALRCRGLLDVADLHVQASACARDAATGALILYGLYDLNRAQEAFVAELLRGGADLLVPLAGEAFGGLATSRGVALAAGLTERGLEARAPADDVGRVAAVWVTGRGAGRAPLVLHGDGSLHIVSVPDERAEAREAVRAVLEAAAAGAALHDCAVVAPGADDVELLATALRAAGLPVACRRPDRSSGPRLLLRLADCLSPVSGATFPRRAVVDLLTAAPLKGMETAPEDSALWLDEARQAGVVAGLEQWRERSGRRRRGLERRCLDLEERVREVGVDDATRLVSGDDEDVVADKLARVRRRLAAARGLDAAAGALERACADLPERASWGAWATALSAATTALFAEPEAQAAGDVAARLAALDVVDETVDIAEVAGVLREQIAAARVPCGRVGRDGVAVLTPLELRGLRFHTVVFTGLAEGGFPVRGRPDPILGDAERRRAAETLGTRLPLSEAREAESDLLFAFACGAARERLVLMAPRTEAASGRPRLPSRILLWLASRAAGRPVGLDEYLGGAPLDPVWRRTGGTPRHALAAVPSGGAASVWADARERDAAVLLAVSELGAREAATEYLSAILDRDTAGRRLAMWRAARDSEPGPWDGLLGAGPRAALLSRSPFAREMPPTRLERYVTCPFAFLLRDVLRLEAPEEPAEGIDMDALEFGQLAHRVLERTYDAVIAEGLDLDGALAALKSAWEAGCAEAEQQGVTGAALAWGARRATLLDDLEESLRRDPVFGRGDGRPSQVEWPFGEAVGRAVSLDLADGREIRFSGRLDRVDETPRGARVIDYKTGKGTTERQRLKDRLSVQLPVYQLALRRAGEGRPAEIECVYRLVTRRGGFRDLSLPDAEPDALHVLRVLVTEALALFEGGVLVRSTAGRCEYCDVAYACGASSWTRARKRRHASLARLVALQSSGPSEVSDAGGA